MKRWRWITGLVMTGIVVLGTHAPLHAQPPRQTLATNATLQPPPLSKEVRDSIYAYLTTPALQAVEAERRRTQLAPKLEQLGFLPGDWSGLVRQVFPFKTPNRIAQGDFITRQSDVSERRNYPIFLPDNYTPDTSWPLHITLHGGRRNGFYCTTYWPQLRHHQPWILLCPSTHKGRFHSEDGEADFIAALHDTLRTFNIDPERISIGGLSTGASAAWALSAKYPGRWRAMVSRSGGPLLFPIDARAPGYNNLGTTPVLILHGKQDTLINVGTARTGVRILKDLNIFHEYWEDPEAGHDIFSQRNRDVEAWIKPRRRAALPSAFTYVPGRLGVASPIVHWLQLDNFPGNLKARIEGNTVTINHTKLMGMTVFLPEVFLSDPNAPIEIIVNGTQVFKDTVAPSMAAAMASYWKTSDHTRTFTRAVALEWGFSAQNGARPRRMWKGKPLR